MKFVRILPVILVGLFSGAAAHAATLTNGGFESGLSGWASTGNTTAIGPEAQSSGFTGQSPVVVSPTEGASQARLTSDGAARNSVLSLFSGIDPNDTVANHDFAISSGLTAVDNSILVDAQTNQPADQNTVDFKVGGSSFFSFGSAISQDVANISAGSTMTFDATFSTGELTQFGAPSAPDAAFLFADGMFHLLFSAGDFQVPSVLLGQDVVSSKIGESYTFANSGPQTIGFAIFDIDGSFGESRLYVDNLEFAAVPLPASLPLLIAGLAGLGWISRRRRKV